jgi:hypothetical protein
MDVVRGVGSSSPARPSDLDAALAEGGPRRRWPRPKPPIREFSEARERARFSVAAE